MNTNYSEVIMEQCVAITKKQKRCANKGRTEFRGLCKHHHNRFNPLDSKSGSTALGKAEKVVKVSGGIIGAVGGMIKIIEFVMQNWEKIKDFNMLIIGGNINGFIPTKALMILEPLVNSASQIRHKGSLIVRQGGCSKAEEIQLRIEFKNWFYRLPDETRRNVENHFGESMIQSLLVS